MHLAVQVPGDASFLAMASSQGWGSSGLTWPVEGIQETWQAEFLLTGGLLPHDRFVHAQIVFDYLTPWAQPASIVTRQSAAATS